MAAVTSSITFDGPDAFLASPTGRVTADGETWAWQVAENGDVWHGDAPNRTIRRHAFLGWEKGGEPRFESEKAESWPWPEDFELVRRVHYDQTTDTLYLSGYLKGESIDSWGVAGKTLRRIDGWMRGPKKNRWTVKLPVNPEGEGEGKPLSPKSLAFAGDYVFVGMVKPEEDKQHIHILAASDARYVGSFVPGPEVGGNAGWLDMPYAMDATRRKDGEYLLLVEEDWRGKTSSTAGSPKPLEEPQSCPTHFGTASPRPRRCLLAPMSSPTSRPIPGRACSEPPPLRAAYVRAVEPSLLSGPHG